MVDHRREDIAEEDRQHQDRVGRVEAALRGEAEGVGEVAAAIASVWAARAAKRPSRSPGKLDLFGIFDVSVPGSFVGFNQCFF